MIRKSNDPEHLDAYTERQFTKGQSCQTLSSGESGYYAAVTSTAEALHLQCLLEFFEMLVKLRLRIDSAAARGIIQPQGPLKHIETRLLWLQAKYEEGKLTVVKEPTLTNTADGFTIALQTAKKLEWRNRLSVVYDNDDDAETSKREALAESGRWAVEASKCDPTLSVGRDLDATNVCDEKTWMERLELAEQGLSKLRAQPWLTVAERVVKEFFVACLRHGPAQHKRCGPRERVDVVHAQTLCRLSVDNIWTSCRHPVCVSLHDQSIQGSVRDIM